MSIGRQQAEAQMDAPFCGGLVKCEEREAAAHARGVREGLERAAEACMKRVRYHRAHARQAREPLPQVKYLESEADNCAYDIRALIAAPPKEGT